MVNNISINELISVFGGQCLCQCYGIKDIKESMRTKGMQGSWFSIGEKSSSHECLVDCLELMSLGYEIHHPISKCGQVKVVEE